MSGAAGPLAVVTGGTGFIGWNLCEALRDAGWRVRAVVRPASGNPVPDGIERWDADLDAAAMAGACHEAQAVFHLAGLTRALSYDDFLRVNAEGARQAAIASRDAGAFFLFVSSQAAGGPGTPETVRTEADPPEPVSDYGRSKLRGEADLAEIEGLRYAVVRPPGVYGARDKDFFALFQAASRGFVPRLGSAAKAYTLVHIDDAVGALRTVADAGIANAPGVLGQTFFIGHATPVTQGQLLASIAATVDRRVRQVPVPLPLIRAIAEVGQLQGMLTGRPALLNRARYRELSAPGFVCSVAKIEAATGWRAAIAIDDGVQATADWYRRAGWL